MIIVAAYVTVKTGMGNDFVKAAQDCIANTRKEAGNISYTLLASTEDPDKFTFFEEWKSRADLGTHMETAHFKAFGKGIEGILAQPLDVKVYNAEPTQ